MRFLAKCTSHVARVKPRSQTRILVLELRNYDDNHGVLIAFVHLFSCFAILQLLRQTILYQRWKPCYAFHQYGNMDILSGLAATIGDVISFFSIISYREQTQIPLHQQHSVYSIRIIQHNSLHYPLASLVGESLE